VAPAVWRPSLCLTQSIGFGESFPECDRLMPAGGSAGSNRAASKNRQNCIQHERLRDKHFTPWEAIWHLRRLQFKTRDG
jgi:hypothetical protein